MNPKLPPLNPHHSSAQLQEPVKTLSQYRLNQLSKALASKYIADRLSSSLPDTDSAAPVNPDEREAAYTDFFDQLETIDAVRRTGVSDAGARCPEEPPAHQEAEGSGQTFKPNDVAEDRIGTIPSKRGHTAVDDSGDRDEAPK